ncbi:MAG: ATP-binding cassette domain-containing protein [Bianqueaceae bacterium]
MESILSIENVSKYFGGKAAVEQFSLSVGEGEIFGLLGPNGAGKTTLIKMIVGHLRVDSGSIMVCGHAIGQEFEAAMSSVGAIVENPAHYLYMSGYENLKLTSMLHTDVERGEFAKSLSRPPTEPDSRQSKTLFTGNAAAAGSCPNDSTHRPKLLVLDEPTVAWIRQESGSKILQNLAREGMTVVVSSHILSEMSLLYPHWHYAQRKLVADLCTGTSVRNMERFV